MTQILILILILILISLPLLRRDYHVSTAKLNALRVVLDSDLAHKSHSPFYLDIRQGLVVELHQ